MRSSISYVLVASLALRVTRAEKSKSGAIWATPHESYSSSVGVLGCKIDTNRVAYWPAAVDCDNICVKVSYEDRSVHLLRIDRSEGAYDISYDAWNYLYTGFPASEKPATGGTVPMDFETVSPEECAHLIHTDDGLLPLSASNSMNYVASCLDQPGGSWVGENHRLYNVLDPICAWGFDEPCELDWPTANQAACPSGIGKPGVLTSAPVYNVQYGTGKTVLASSGAVVEDVPYDSLAKVRYAKAGVSIALPGQGKAKVEPGSGSRNGTEEFVSADAGFSRQLYVPLSVLMPLATLFWIG